MSTSAPSIEKLQHGVYRKLMTENTDAPCTIALSSYQDTKQISQSAKVQSATTLNQRTMSEYRFHLQKYRPGSKTTCPSCGKSRCFVRYIDEQGNICFPENVGKCDVKTVVATTIHLKNTSRIILMCWKWMRETASRSFLPLISRR